MLRYSCVKKRREGNQKGQAIEGSEILISQLNWWGKREREREKKKKKKKKKNSVKRWDVTIKK